MLRSTNPHRAREWRDQAERVQINASVIGATMAALAGLSVDEKRRRITELVNNKALRGRSVGEWWAVFGAE